MGINRFPFIRLLGAVLLGLASLEAAAMAKGLHVNYSSTGSATYADGTPVLDGEWFVLVWKAEGATIDLAKDITGDVNSFLDDNWNWLVRKKSVNGKCNSGNYDSISNRYEKGSVQLYLLDTRISKTELAPLGTNREGKKFPTIVNAVVPIEGATYSWTSFDANYHKIEGPAPATTAWTAIARATPVPVIVSFTHADGASVVGATNTLATSSYVLKRASDVAFANVTWTSAATNGAAFVTTPLVISDPAATASAAFYRIEAVNQ